MVLGLVPGLLGAIKINLEVRTRMEEEKESTIDIGEFITKERVIMLLIILSCFFLALLFGYFIGWNNAMVKCAEQTKDCIFLTN